MNPALIERLERETMRQPVAGKGSHVWNYDEERDKRESKPRYKNKRVMKLREAQS